MGDSLVPTPVGGEGSQRLVSVRDVLLDLCRDSDSPYPAPIGGIGRRLPPAGLQSLVLTRRKELANVLRAVAKVNGVQDHGVAPKPRRHIPRM